MDSTNLKFSLVWGMLADVVEPLSASSDEVSSLGLVIKALDEFGQFYHIGILYKVGASAAASVFHLKWHHVVANEAPGYS